MRAAIAVNDIVVNIIEAPSVAVAQSIHPSATAFSAANVGIGWLKDGSSWVAPPVPAPTPKSLTHLEFIEHAQTAGDMTGADLVAAKGDANLAAFWLKFELATSLERDHPTTAQGLAALVATGHLTEAGREAIVELWPTA